ncbi:hypothetical protein TNCV_1264331 [Trichonephila clavipes]|nr:hypothetical protein TNCV_1264331 [Trichonephila clavipes]
MESKDKENLSDLNVQCEKKCVSLSNAVLHSTSGLELDAAFCSEADGPTNLQQPPQNPVRSDTQWDLAFVWFQKCCIEKNCGLWERQGIVCTHDPFSLELLESHTEEHCLTEKLPVGKHLEKFSNGSKKAINIALAHYGFLYRK